MPKREFLAQAHTYIPTKHSLLGKMLSEKLDGQRFFWDGGVTRGLQASVVPWANTDKDARYINTQMATGLWSRYGKAIQAPDWFLDKMPPFVVEGELWMGHGRFQELSSIVRSSVNLADWTGVRAMILDAPHPSIVLTDSKIKTTHYTKIFDGCYTWWRDKGGLDVGPGPMTRFLERHSWLKKNITLSNTVSVLLQERLPVFTADAERHVSIFVDDVLDRGGEGIVIKSGASYYQCARTYDTLKYKPWHDAEGVVVGYTWGKETDLGSKLLGKMGALILKSPNGLEFKISGFTNDERQMLFVGSEANADWVGVDYSGERVPDDIYNPKFPRGSSVTYKYRELTDAGLPKEARYWRRFHP